MKKFLFLILCISLIYNVSSRTNDNEEIPKEIFDEGISEFKSENFKKAAPLFEELIEDYEDTQYANQSFFYLGEVYNEMTNQYRESALSSFEKSSLIYSGNNISKRALFKIAEIYRNNGDKEELQNVQSRLINSFPDDKEIKSVYVEKINKTEDSKEKINLIDNYLDNYRSCPERNNMQKKLFNEYIKIENYDGARSVFRNLDRQDIDEDNLVKYYYNTNQKKQAERILKRNNMHPQLIKKAKENFNYPEAVRLYEEMLENKKFQKPDKILEFINLLQTLNESKKALSVLYDFEFVFEGEKLRPVFLYKAGILNMGLVSFFLDESGYKYHKDTNSLEEAVNLFSKIYYEYPESNLTPNALLKIIEIEKEHLFDWDNLQETAKILINNYRDTSQAELAKETMKEYRFKY
ncbi:MAG: tetratricopeptide repeat protein [Candidatus Muiribacteriota bacterium]